MAKVKLKVVIECKYCGTVVVRELSSEDIVVVSHEFGEDLTYEYSCAVCDAYEEYEI